MKWILLASLAAMILGCATSKSGQAARDSSANPHVATVAPLETISAYPGAAEVKRSTHEGVSELDLSTPESLEKVQAFYEAELKAKAMPMGSGLMSIQTDYQGRHYQVDYGRFGSETTIAISIK